MGILLIQRGGDTVQATVSERFSGLLMGWELLRAGIGPAVSAGTFCLWQHTIEENTCS